MHRLITCEIPIPAGDVSGSGEDDPGKGSQHLGHGYGVRTTILLQNCVLANLFLSCECMRRVTFEDRRVVPALDAVEAAELAEAELHEGERRREYDHHEHVGHEEGTSSISVRKQLNSFPYRFFAKKGGST